MLAISKADFGSKSLKEQVMFVSGAKNTNVFDNEENILPQLITKQLDTNSIPGYLQYGKAKSKVHRRQTLCHVFIFSSKYVIGLLGYIISQNFNF